MKITIECEPKEIADLVKEVQSQPLKENKISVGDVKLKLERKPFEKRFSLVVDNQEEDL